MRVAPYHSGGPGFGSRAVHKIIEFGSTVVTRRFMLLKKKKKKKILKTAQLVGQIVFIFILNPREMRNKLK